MAKGKNYPKPKQIYVDDEVWEKAKEVLSDVGISRSQFIEISMRNLTRLESAPGRMVYQSVMDDLWACARDKVVDKIVEAEKEVLSPVRKRKTKPKKEG